MESAWTFLPLKLHTPPLLPVAECPDNWKTAACAFDDKLGSFGNNAPAAGFPQAVIGLFGRTNELLRAWANERNAQLLEPPPTEALLDGAAALWPELQNPNGTIFVIPAMERCFLRHYRGIRLARKLVETMWTQPRRLMIGCDAWGWKYLTQAVQIDALCSEPLTAAPLMALPEAAPMTADIAPRAKESRLRAFVLHTLLLHTCVTASILTQLLPFRTTEVLKTLADLRGKKLAVEENGGWRVASAHYSSIRRQLLAAGFWVSDQ